ncbi:MAG: DNA translocase FtsK [Pleomorphochaeta sp.]
MKEKKSKDNINKKTKRERKKQSSRRKGGKFSLFLAILLLIASIVLIGSTVISLIQMPPKLVGYATIISDFAKNNLSFIKSNLLYVLPPAIALMVLSIMIFVYRRNKPYSYFKIIIFGFFTYSVYLICLHFNKLPMPKYLSRVLSNDLGSSEIAFRIFISLIFELILLIIANPICNFLNNRREKKQLKKVKNIVEDKLKQTEVKEEVKPEINIKESKLGVEFPKPIDVPNLSFLDSSAINNDIGEINTPSNVEKYQRNTDKSKNKIEDDLDPQIDPRHTISLETLKIAKRNVEEKMSKLNQPQPIKKAPPKSTPNKDNLTFQSILQQRVQDNSNEPVISSLDVQDRKESPIVKEYREKEIKEAQEKVSSIYNSKIRNNSAVQKKKNDDYLNDPLKNIMRGGHLIKATEQHSLNNNIDKIVEKVEENQTTASIIDEINKSVITPKHQEDDDFSDIDFGEDVEVTIPEVKEEKPLEKPIQVKSSDLNSNNASPTRYQSLKDNQVAVNNYYSSAKPVGDAQLVDEKEDSIRTFEDDDEDLESAIAGLSCSSLLDPNKFSYKFPPLSLLYEYPQSAQIIDDDTKNKARLLIETLAQFKYDVELRNIIKGPSVTMFEIVPAPGIKVNAITNLRDNIAMNLAAKKVRILAPIPGQNAVGVEIPNTIREKVGFKEVLTSDNNPSYAIPMAMGRTLYGQCKSFDVATAPHMLIAGSTGSGKSVCVNSLICSILYSRTPRDVRLIMVDPKVVELTIYNGIPHLLTPVITEPKRALKALDFCIDEMDRRNKMLAKMNVRNIKSYNKKIKDSNIAKEKMPYIVVIIDEFASLMSTAGKDLDEKVARLTAMSRAVGIHLVFATQRPSVDVITGVIKNNLPTRVAFAVTSTQDSRTIIGNSGAEDLLGKGDMLFSANGKAVTRMQGVFLSDEEVEKVVEFAKQQEEPDYIDESYFEDPYDDEPSESVNSNDDEELWDAALQIAYERNGASASFLQRRLKIGYNRAARIIEEMEEQGILGPQNGSKPRELLRYQ